MHEILYYIIRSQVTSLVGRRAPPARHQLSFAKLRACCERAGKARAHAACGHNKLVRNLKHSLLPPSLSQPAVSLSLKFGVSVVAYSRQVKHCHAESWKKLLLPLPFPIVVAVVVDFLGCRSRRAELIMTVQSVPCEQAKRTHVQRRDSHDIQAI